MKATSPTPTIKATVTSSGAESILLGAENLPGKAKVAFIRSKTMGQFEVPVYRFASQVPKGTKGAAIERGSLRLIGALHTQFPEKSKVEIEFE